MTTTAEVQQEQASAAAAAAVDKESLHDFWQEIVELQEKDDFEEVANCIYAETMANPALLLTVDPDPDHGHQTLTEVMCKLERCPMVRDILDYLIGKGVPVTQKCYESIIGDDFDVNFVESLLNSGYLPQHISGEKSLDSIFSEAGYWQEEIEVKFSEWIGTPKLQVGVTHEKGGPVDEWLQHQEQQQESDNNKEKEDRQGSPAVANEKEKQQAEKWIMIDSPFHENWNKSSLSPRSSVFMRDFINNNSNKTKEEGPTMRHPIVLATTAGGGNKLDSGDEKKKKKKNMHDDGQKNPVVGKKLVGKKRCPVCKNPFLTKQEVEEHINESNGKAHIKYRSNNIQNTKKQKDEDQQQHKKRELQLLPPDTGNQVQQQHLDEKPMKRPRCGIY